MSVSTPPNPKVTRRGLLRRAVRGGIGLGALGVTGTAWGSGEANSLETNSIELTLPRLPAAFDGFRIAQISDIHIEGGSMRDRLPKISRYVSSLKPDAIVITGDYTTHADDWQEDPLAEGLKPLEATYGIFGILGNHDQWNLGDDLGRGAQVARSALKRAGARELGNAAFAIERKGEKLWICGIDDWAKGKADLASVEATLPPQSCAILLAHEPDFADIAAPTGRFDLMLSGHSHGGQISLPFAGPVYLPWGGRKYPRGRYQVGGMTLYTNCGLGVIDVPLRVCARPEVTVFTLRCAGN
jgi:predicted MPP superfamily phosphohydrolase